MDKKQWDSLPCYDRAWRLYLIMRYMNNEDAYYSGWLYIWPDGSTYEDCMYYFDDEESYKELEDSFKRHYSVEEIHEDGLFSSNGVPQSVIEDAHMWDEILGLKPIVEQKLSH